MLHSLNAIVIELFNVIGEIEIKRNQIIKTLKILPKEYEVSFEVKPTSKTNATYSNVIHLTVGGNNAAYGDRTPAVWIYFSNFFFSSALNGSTSGNFQSNVVMNLLEWTKIKISQLLMKENYVFTIWVADNIIYNVINFQAREFQNVMVYIGDPWYVAQPGYIRNLVIKNAYIGKKLVC